MVGAGDESDDGEVEGVGGVVRKIQKEWTTS